MKKILLSVLVLFMASAFYSAHAQAQDSQEEMRTLAQRVDSLEHELSYLQLDYQLYTLKSDIEMLKSEVVTKSIEIRLDFYNRNLDSGLCDSYNRLYEVYQSSKQSKSKLIDIMKLLFIVKKATSSYSESELDKLETYYNTIDSAYNTLEASMSMLKTCIDMYNESCK